MDVEYNGKKELVSIKIHSQQYDIDDIEMLEDMILIASKDALSKVDKEIENKLGSIGSGLGGLF